MARGALGREPGVGPGRREIAQGLVDLHAPAVGWGRSLGVGDARLARDEPTTVEHQEDAGQGLHDDGPFVNPGEARLGREAGLSERTGEPGTLGGRNRALNAWVLGGGPLAQPD